MSAIERASQSERRFKIHLSGFGPFQGVANNPTTTLMEEIKDYLAQNPIPSDLPIDVASVTVYETSAVGMLQQFIDVLSEAGLTRHTINERKHEKHVFLHFGVYSSQGKYFALEQVAYNEADFRVPDERGWKPKSQTIFADMGDTKHELRTSLPLHGIASKLVDEGFSVQLSTDPGRFLCNFIYYNSLRYGKLHNAESLFIHVPIFSTLSKETQLAFVRALIIATVKCMME